MPPLPQFIGTKMRIYHFKGKGKCLAAEVVIRAHNQKFARVELKKYCANKDLAYESFKMVEAQVDSTKAKVIYAWDGDY